MVTWVRGAVGAHVAPRVGEGTKWGAGAVTTRSMEASPVRVTQWRSTPPVTTSRAQVTRVIECCCCWKSFSVVSLYSLTGIVNSLLILPIQIEICIGYVINMVSVQDWFGTVYSTFTVYNWNEGICFGILVASTTSPPRPTTTTSTTTLPTTTTSPAVTTPQIVSG